jgi:UDP-N-acetylglucosamine--N-acetylmuramyl-(pentapeptide) pyrophosphoryl-undecaprenol N-acetylglucosamine transferase
MSQSKPLTIALAAGGTGGHMFPADALSRELQERGHTVILVTDKRGLKYPGLFKGVTNFVVEAGSIARGGIIARLMAAVDILAGAIEARRVLKKHGVQVVVGFGGYPALPAVIAARVMGLKYCLHEQNAVLGRVNRLMVKGASALALSFKGTRKIPKHSKRKSILIGNPVRKEILQVGLTPYPSLGEDHVLRVMVVGGSQGASIFSDIVPEALAMLPRAFKDQLQVTQQCREEDLERVQARYDEEGIKAETMTFIEDMAGRLTWSHLVIGRSGAMTVTELATSGRPSILVPLPTSVDNHQVHNAEALSDVGAGWLVPQPEFNARELAKQIQKLSSRQSRLSDAAKLALSVSRPDATKHLADLVEQMVLGSKSFKGYLGKAIDDKQKLNGGPSKLATPNERRARV